MRETAGETATGDAGPAACRETPWAPAISRGVPIPWWAKLAAKQVLARLPLDYRAWARLGLFRHGRTDRDPDVPVAQFLTARAWHLARTGTPPRATLELGPGDALGTALAGAATGVERAVLMDAGDYATRDMAAYRAVAAHLAARGMALPEDLPLTDRDTLLAATGARYLTGGVASLAAVPDGSVDLTFSFAVLEHVKLAEMPLLVRELHRITAPGGTGYHYVDLTDHLGGGMNHLRFPARVWEARWFARGAPYTNRLREPAIVALAEQAGFAVTVPERRAWTALPLPRARLDRGFRDLPAAALRSATFVLGLTKPRV
jgi:SAM-dependent methyltransferase